MERPARPIGKRVKKLRVSMATTSALFAYKVLDEKTQAILRIYDRPPPFFYNAKTPTLLTICTKTFCVA